MNTFLSICSGIEAATVAWDGLFVPAAYAEIDPFCCRLLQHHYSHVANLGDITAHPVFPTAHILIGGTPCQSFSVAGLRAGLDDPRGNLALEFLAIAHRTRPAWVVWENVAGCLSVDKGRAFGSIVGGLGQLGYGWAYRVLDAQHFGVPQRRRRVFLVGRLGDWRGPVAVLFERASLSGNTQAGTEERQDTAPTLASGSGGGRYDKQSLTAPTLPARTKGGGGFGTDAECDGAIISTLTSGMHRGSNAQDADKLIAKTLLSHRCPRGDEETDTIIAHSLRADGFDASEDGTGRGTPLVQAIFQESQSGLREHAIAGSLRANGPGHDPVGSRVRTRSGVRRLTPRECERLQGFPDDYTAIPKASDSARYKALGNSIAVPVLRWIGERMARVDAIPPTGAGSAWSARFSGGFPPGAESTTPAFR